METLEEEVQRYREGKKFFEDLLAWVKDDDFARRMLERNIANCERNIVRLETA